MKKLLFIGAAVCLVQIAFSQSRFGIRGGLNIANQKIKVNAFGSTVSQSGNAIPSFHIGGIGEFQLTDLFFVQPSLMLSGKGSNIDGQDPNTGDPLTAKIRPYYLELPVLLLAKGNLPTTNLKIFGGAGPSFGYGLFGKVKSGSESDDAFQDGGLKRFDFGIDLTAGVETQSGVQFSFHFTPGIANIGPSDDTYDLSWKNRVMAFSVAYYFSGNSK